MRLRALLAACGIPAIGGVVFDSSRRAAGGHDNQASQLHGEDIDDIPDAMFFDALQAVVRKKKPAESARDSTSTPSVVPTPQAAPTVPVAPVADDRTLVETRHPDAGALYTQEESVEVPGEVPQLEAVTAGRQTEASDAHVFKDLKAELDVIQHHMKALSHQQAALSKKVSARIGKLLHGLMDPASSEQLALAKATAEVPGISLPVQGNKSGSQGAHENDTAATEGGAPRNATGPTPRNATGSAGTENILEEGNGTRLIRLKRLQFNSAASEDGDDEDLVGDSDFLSVNVTIPGKQAIVLSLDPATTVHDVKRLLEARSRLRPERMRITSAQNGRLLAESDKINQTASMLVLSSADEAVEESGGERGNMTGAKAVESKGKVENATTATDKKVEAQPRKEATANQSTVGVAANSSSAVPPAKNSTHGPVNSSAPLAGNSKAPAVVGNSTAGAAAGNSTAGPAAQNNTARAASV